MTNMTKQTEAVILVKGGRAFRPDAERDLDHN
ncbi:hypothetical protein J2Z28_003488 [Paenibacillus xylanexedens]|uniref:Uncharacterized protein n=1 Tax=Paenibacillus xylanexedens TaxID=528191 RepID=A0ABS4RVC4_PAEXY|nr:hypothetical protein [Paenibacillus xylanexedens]